MFKEMTGTELPPDLLQAETPGFAPIAEAKAGDEEDQPAVQGHEAIPLKSFMDIPNMDHN